MKVLAGKSRVRLPMRSLEFSIDLTIPDAIMTLKSTQPLIKMNTRNLSGGKGRPALKAAKHSVICEPTV
jgi:hypothetical protein